MAGAGAALAARAARGAADVSAGRDRLAPVREAEAARRKSPGSEHFRARLRPASSPPAASRCGSCVAGAPAPR